MLASSSKFFFSCRHIIQYNSAKHLFWRRVQNVYSDSLFTISTILNIRNMFKVSNLCCLFMEINIFINIWKIFYNRQELFFCFLCFKKKCYLNFIKNAVYGFQERTFHKKNHDTYDTLRNKRKQNNKTKQDGRWKVGWAFTGHYYPYYFNFFLENTCFAFKQLIY